MTNTRWGGEKVGYECDGAGLFFFEGWHGDGSCERGFRRGTRPGTVQGGGWPGGRVMYRESMFDDVPKSPRLVVTFTGRLYLCGKEAFAAGEVICGALRQRLNVPGVVATVVPPSPTMRWGGGD